MASLNRNQSFCSIHTHAHTSANAHRDTHKDTHTQGYTQGHTQRHTQEHAQGHTQRHSFVEPFAVHLFKLLNLEFHCRVVITILKHALVLHLYIAQYTSAPDNTESKTANVGLALLQSSTQKAVLAIGTHLQEESFPSLTVSLIGLQTTPVFEAEV